MKRTRLLSKLSSVAFFCALSVGSAQAQEVDMNFYGFLKGSYLYSTDSISSFGADSVQAPTEAQNLDLTGTTQTSEYKSHSKSAFQAAQSRFGFKLKSSDKLSGTFEFDLVDFTNNPIGKNDARVRLAEIQYKFSDEWSMRVGQGWSTFAAVLPHTINFVGSGFRSGSTGFLAQQAEITRTMGTFALSGSVGYKGRNITGFPTTNGAGNALVQDVNHVGLPAFAMKAEWKEGTQKAGAAAIYAQFEHDKGPLATGEEKETESAGGKLYYSGGFGPVEVRAQAYAGTNLNDLFLLTLASNAIRAAGTPNRNVMEYGTFASVNYVPAQGHEIYGGFGIADVATDEEKLGIGALIQNQTARLGYLYQIEKGLKLFGELTQYNSTYLVDNLTSSSKEFHTDTVELGVLYNF